MSSIIEKELVIPPRKDITELRTDAINAEPNDFKQIVLFFLASLNDPNRTYLTLDNTPEEITNTLLQMIQNAHLESLELIKHFDFPEAVANEFTIQLIEKKLAAINASSAVDNYITTTGKKIANELAV